MPHKIIIDTDPGVDDAAALLFAHRHPEIDLLAVTTVFGNADIEQVTANALYLKQCFGYAATVAQGASRALVRPSGPLPTHVHGNDGLGDIARGRTGQAELDPRPAHHLITELVRANPGEIALVAIGRLTNLALALNHAPEIAGLVRNVVVMGGAFSTSGPNGNVTPAAEANIIGDPEAADQVFGASWPVTAIGLDVTRKTILTRSDFEVLSHAGPAQAMLADLSLGYLDYHRRFGLDGCYMHDTSALGFVVRPDMFTTRSGPVRVVCEGVAVGQTIQAIAGTPYPPNGWDVHPEQAVAIDVDHEALRVHVLDVLSAPQEMRD